MTSRGRAARVAAAAAAIAAVAGCAAAPASPTSGALAGLRPRLTVEPARRALQQLPVRPDSGGAYRRGAFGERWADVDGNGCNQRDDTLLRDALAGSPRTARQGRCDHDVLAGAWRDPYTGSLLRLGDLKQPAQAESITIDHVVPLKEAFRSGADGWSPQRRVLFANDLSNLVSVSARSNSSKGDGDPAHWLPQPAAQCAYARAWVGVKRQWQLTVDTAERAALHRLLAGC